MFGRKPANSAPRADLPNRQAAKPAPAARPRGTATPRPSQTARSGPMDQSAQVVRRDYYPGLRAAVFDAIDVGATLNRPRDQVRRDIATIVAEHVERERLPVPQMEQDQVATEILNDMFGLGPIEPLLSDDDVNDIMVNGPDHVYVERRGLLELTPLKFRDDAHVLNVAQRIAASIGRRVDESSPMVDARLADGSRVNIIVPPLALDGVVMSIRKFARRDLTLQRMAMGGSMSTAMAQLLEIAAACRLNIIVSGGTGSGKTTLLNAISRYIDTRERIVTIEDAAELQLQQPHVVRLETRPPNLEGEGAVTQQDLVRNALRMRPDRIILGETRGSEAFDVLQAMNTGHNGSMTTLHANSPRDALVRLESMLMMATATLPLTAIRRQIASAVHVIVQIERGRDGKRRVTHISELVGMESDTIMLQDLFVFQFEASASFGEGIRGSFEPTGLRPGFTETARYYGMEPQLREVMQP